MQDIGLESTRIWKRVRREDLVNHAHGKRKEGWYLNKCPSRLKAPREIRADVNCDRDPAIQEQHFTIF